MMGTVAVILLASSLLAAPASDEDAYWADRICYANTDIGDGTLVPVVDTFDIRWDINAGSTSAHFMPCVPWECPEPFTLISGNVCSATDPFAHIVFDDEPAVAGGAPVEMRDAPVEPGVDVGPLVEPAIQTVGTK